MTIIRVLYVDDEPDLLELGKIFLEKGGQFLVDTITSAPEALALLNSAKYDAIVSDYQMPDMDGIEFLRKVRTSGNHIPFILFTGRGREEVVIQALNEGADFYLQKGGNPTPQFTELSHKICQAVQKRLAEGLLLESQVQIRTVVDSIPVGIVTIDAKTHRILNANQKAIDMIGADADEIAGQVCHKFICPADVGKCPVTDLGQRVDLSERVLLTRKGNRIPILKSVMSTIMNGKEVLIESFFDISERKRSEMIFQTLIRSMVGKTGLESLNEITTNVCKWLGTDIAVIMELTPDMKHGRILSMQPGSGIIPEVLHPLEGTPCGFVVERGFYLCPDNVQELFPDFKMPFNFAVRSYVGIALRNSAGNVIGAICSLSHDPLTAPPQLQEIFEIIGVKAAAEIERKQTEEVLRQSEERFRVLLQNVPGVAIQGYRMDGTTFFWDEGSENTYGYTAKEAVGKNLVDLIIPPEMREDVKVAIAYMAQTGQPIPASELSLLKKDGSRVAVFSSHVILRRAQGEMELYCLDMDLTERKRTEETIQKSGREWQTTFDTITDVVYLSDDKGRIVRHNRAFETFTGKSAGEIDGRYCYEVLHGITVPITGCPNVKSNVSRKRESIELNIDQRWFVATVDPIFDTTGEISGAVHLIIDITERKRAEEAFRQANVKLNLLSGITRHDIKNQLLILDGFLDILRMNIPDSSLDKHFSRITKASSSISAMIEFTGEYEKIGVIAPAWQDCRTLVNTAAGKAALGTVRLKNDFPAGIEIFADPLIVKVFYNLMDNASRYGAKITTIRFSAEECYGNRIIVCEDDGNGIPADEKERIFERGFGKNTGMGLFLAREILSITGITIQETGEPGRGARFEILVPKGAFRASGA
ncbi:MAG: PAS domain S-box protein [Methanoregula sp.]|nr:PAS domain S-box protein [Methanoregula sp.]